MHWVKHITHKHTHAYLHTPHTHTLQSVSCWEKVSFDADLKEVADWENLRKRMFTIWLIVDSWKAQYTASCLWKIKACRFWVDLKGRHGQQMLLHQNNTEYISDSERSTRLQGTVVKPTYISEGRAILCSWDCCPDIIEYISEQRTKLLSQHSHRVHFRM